MEISATYTVIRVVKKFETNKIKYIVAVPATKQEYVSLDRPDKVDCGDIQIRQIVPFSSDDYSDD